MKSFRDFFFTPSSLFPVFGRVGTAFGALPQLSGPGLSTHCQKRWKPSLDVLHQDQGAFDRLARLLKLKLTGGHRGIPGKGL